MRHMRDGFADDAVRHRFGLVVPHVLRALLIGNVIELHKIEAAALADSLDTLASAMFIVDATGRIVHANASGFTMISEAKVVNAPNGRLRSIDPSADQSFQEIFTAAEAGDAALGRKGIAIPLRARDGVDGDFLGLPLHHPGAVLHYRFQRRLDPLGYIIEVK